MIKSALRRIYKEKRLTLSPQQRMKMDDLLLIQFKRLGFDGVQVLMSYSPIEARAEMNTDLYTRYLQHIIPALQICYPVINTADNNMHAVLVDDESEYAENIYGIAEPVGTTIAQPADIDLVFVPLLAFDEEGYRVGYGKGYYDRFLKLCRPDVITVGFSYFEAVDKIEDANQYDVPLNYCITPQKLYEF